MISEEKKGEIVSAIVKEKGSLGSMNNVAKKLGISAATISHNLMKADNWRNVSDSMWSDIASALGVSLVDRGWKLVDTTNMAIMTTVLSDAQSEGMFIAVSEKAGSGKTSAIARYLQNDVKHSVYVLQCEEWSKKSFLLRLSKELGVKSGKYDTCEMMIESIIRFFKQRAKEVAPLMILDEADKLKPAALRFLIPLYNRLEDEIGLVACGTENLEKEVKNGVRRQMKGYDEIDSRLGRNFVHLMGSSHSDVTRICNANGIADQGVIDQIFEKSDPETKIIGGKRVQLVGDLRRVKRRIKAERLRVSNAA